MNAEIIAVGSEMLTPEKIDTNSLYLTEQLNTLGVEVVAKAIIGDDRARLTDAIRGAMSRSDLLILSGGLGPTEDDLTRDAVAAAMGVEQRFDQAVCDGIAARFARMGRHMAENNKRQAFVVDGAEVMPNDRGTAPGQFVRHGNTVVFLLPGPPHELKAMYQQQCLPRLEKLLPPQVIRTRFFRVAGMGESDLDAQIAPVYTKYTNPVTTILAAASDIQIHLRARATEAAEAERLLNEVADQIEAILGDRIYSRDGSPLEEAVGVLLRERGETVCVAESATGGLIGQRLTSVPGSSQYFLGGFITYTNAMKRTLLGVSEEMLQAHSEVSEPVAEAMAKAARERTGATYGISVTGYAGPDGGSPENPVGTVYIGVAGAQNCVVQRLTFLADRARFRTLASQNALNMLRRQLLTGS